MPAASIIRNLRSRFAGPFDLQLETGGCAAITGAYWNGQRRVCHVRDRHSRPDHRHSAAALVPRYAVALSGIILGNVLNSASLSFDSLLGSVDRERAAIEARLCLGATYREAVAPLVRNAIRRALLPIVNQMSAAGIVTLPGIMTGQILAGLDALEAAKYQILLMFLLSGGSGSRL